MAKRITFVTLGEHLLSPSIDCRELFLNRLEFEFTKVSSPSDVYVLRLDLPGEGDDIYGAFSSGVSWVFRARDGRASVQASYPQQFPLARQHRAYKINRLNISIRRLDGSDWSVDQLPSETPSYNVPKFILDLSIMQ